MAKALDVHAPVISDRETNRSRGFGFVEVADNDAPKSARI